jgi:hypothetical protein
MYIQAFEWLNRNQDMQKCDLTDVKYKVSMILKNVTKKRTLESALAGHAKLDVYVSIWTINATRDGIDLFEKKEYQVLINAQEILSAFIREKMGPKAETRKVKDRVAEMFANTLTECMVTTNADLEDMIKNEIKKMGEENGKNNE